MNAPLTRSQLIGAGLLLVLIVGFFGALHFFPAVTVTAVPARDTTKRYTKAHYDSIRAARRAYYDSLRLVRRDSIYHAIIVHRDSMRRADSLWWDSVFTADSLSRPPRIAKYDTIVELNTADTTDLQHIRGIGAATARRIVRYREQLGGYTDVRQLQDPQLYMDDYGHLRPNHYTIPDSVLVFFTVEQDSVHRIAVNHASVERLQRHPYISFTMAKAIYTLRRKYLRLRCIDELRSQPMMTDSVINRLTPYLDFAP